MKVTRKLMLGVVASSLSVGLVNSVMRVRREEQTFLADMRRDHDFVGRTVRAAWIDVWRTHGPARADQMVRNADSAHPSIRVRVRVGEGGPCAPPPGASAHTERAVVVGDDLVSCYPIREGDVPRALEVHESRATQRRYFRVSVLRNLFTFAATAIVVIVLIYVVGERFIGRPIEALRAKSRRIGDGDLGGPLTLAPDDEFGELAREINAMCERLAAAQRAVEEHHRRSLRAVEDLRHADRLSTVGQLASGLAHELGTPLNVVLARAGLLAAGDNDPAEVTDSARVIAEQTRRMTAMIRQLLDFARRREADKREEDLAAVTAQAVTLLRPVARKASVEIELSAPTPQAAWVDAGQIHQILMNLMMNAIQAMPGGGRMGVAVDAVTRVAPAETGLGGDARRWCCITVDDEGDGVAPEHRARVFDPFFTTKGVGEGTGLGLSISHSLAREHGGWISLEPRAPRGTRFALFVPAAES